MTEDEDTIEAFEREETARKLPVGWLVLYIGLILWGLWYLLSFTPAISGWSHLREFEQSQER